MMAFIPVVMSTPEFLYHVEIGDEDGALTAHGLPTVCLFIFGKCRRTNRCACWPIPGNCSTLKYIRNKSTDCLLIPEQKRGLEPFMKATSGSRIFRTSIRETEGICGHMKNGIHPIGENQVGGRNSQPLGMQQRMN